MILAARDEAGNEGQTAAFEFRLPERDVALHVEAFRRQGERVERGEHACLGVAVERQYPPLLDQRARHRFRERGPAQGCSVKSLVLCPTPFLVRACGNTRGKSGAL
jgi:hypothetical protein